MRKFRLENMTKGWFVGDFVPSVLTTKDFEVAYREFKKGQKEARHVHKVAQEITVIAQGRARMGSETVEAGDIVLLDPGEDTDFEALEDGAVVVVKSPSVKGDKYVLG